MQSELFPNLLSGSLRLLHELLGSEKFELALGTTC
jgi:hypothetical protein